jgi:catalase
VLAADGLRAGDLDQVGTALCGAGAVVEVISAALAPVRSIEGRPVAVDRTLLTTASVLYDAVYVPGGSSSVEALLADDDAIEFVRESFRHAKPIGASNEGAGLLEAARVTGMATTMGEGKRKPLSQHGVVTGRGDDLSDFADAFIAAIRQHRHFDRERSRAKTAGTRRTRT